jgi:hypothetical protein
MSLTPMRLSWRRKFHLILDENFQEKSFSKVAEENVAIFFLRR